MSGIYESMWNLIGFVLLMVAFFKTKKLGTLTGIYLTYYGLGRIWIEGLRTDSLYLGPLRVSQWLSAIIVVIGLVILVYNYIIKRKDEADEQKS